MSQARSVSVVLLLLFVFSSLLFAQSNTSGALGGVVLDPSRAVVSNAQITATNSSTGQWWSSPSAADGHFQLVALPPGLYEVSVHSIGFGNTTLRVQVEVGRITDFEVRLQIGVAEHAIEVNTEIPLISTTQSDFSHNIDEQTIHDLPVNGRRWSNLALLTPGASPDGNFGQISFRGITGLQNNNTVDGGDNNQAFFSEERGRTRISYVTSQSSVREFQVNTSNFSAEYGRAAGAVVNSITKSGGNSMHGQAFYYIRDNALGAMNPFSFLPEKNAAGYWMIMPVKPEDRRQQFGISLGGPIVKNRLFYFFTWDQQKRNFPAVATSATPDLFAKPCLIYSTTGLTTGQYQDGCYSDELYTLKDVMSSSTLLQRYNAFNSAIDYLASFTGITPRRSDQLVLFPKLDWKIAQNHSASISYNRMHAASPGGAETRSVYNLGTHSFGDDYVRVDTLNARITSVLRAGMTNELRLLHSRDFEFELAQKPAAGEPLTGPYGNAPQISVASSSYGMSFGTPATFNRYAYPDERRSQISDTGSWQIDKHLLKGGFDVNRVNDRMNNLYDGGGAYSYSSRAYFANDYIQWKAAGAAGYTTDNRGFSLYTQSFGRSEIAFNTTDFSLFGQDNWRIFPTITLSFGVRYEYEKMPAPQFGNPSLPVTYNQAIDKNNLAPRFGFAWDIMGNGKTSLRGGYGMYYGRITNSTIASALLNTGTADAQRSYVWLYTNTDAPVFPNTFSAAQDPILNSSSTARAGITYFSSKAQNPQIHQADLILERQLAPNMMISASYLLSLGRELPNFVDANLDPASIVSAGDSNKNPELLINGGPQDGSILHVPFYTARLNSNYGYITQITTGVNSVYNALMIQLNRRMRQGLQYRMSYTWSHAIDNGQNSTTFSVDNNTTFPGAYTYILDGKSYRVKNPDRGSSNFDIRQRLVGSLIYIPGWFRKATGWQKKALDNWAISPIFTVSTGRPYSEYISGTPSAIPDTCNGCTGLFGTGGSLRLPFMARNSFRYPNLQNLDLRLSKRLQLSESRKVEFLAEAFNVFNHTNITDIADQMYSISGSTLYYNSTFGKATAAGNTLYRERQIQFGAKFDF